MFNIGIRLDKFLVNIAFVFSLNSFSSSLRLKRFSVLVSLYLQVFILETGRLVNVALQNRRSIQYIVSKCTEAIAGVYRARVDQDDRDLTFLVLNFGGPSLLDILYRAMTPPKYEIW